MSINGSTCSSGNLPNYALKTSLNALQTFTTEAELANGTNALDLGTSLGITGVTDAKLTLSMTQIPQVAFGPVGTTASTAQLTSDLQLNYLGVGIINIPLSAAQGTATLSTLYCPSNSMGQTDIQPATTTVSGTVTTPVGNGTLTLSGYNSGTTSPFPYTASGRATHRDDGSERYQPPNCRHDNADPHLDRCDGPRREPHLHAAHLHVVGRARPDPPGNRRGRRRDSGG